MNWVDLVIIVGLAFSLFWGAKRGFLRESLGFLGFIIGIVIAVNYVDWATEKVLTHIKASPQAISFLSFIFLFALVFLGFKIIGFIFYKVASLQPLGKVDKLGGAVFGVLQGWLILGFVFFLLVFLPLPESFARSVDNSFFGPSLRGTVPFVYEESSTFHPQNKSLMGKLRKALLRKTGSEQMQMANPLFGEKTFQESDKKVDKLLSNLERYFGNKNE